MTIMKPVEKPITFITIIWWGILWVLGRGPLK